MESTEKTNWQDGGWELVHSGTLPDKRDLQSNCQVPMETVLNAVIPRLRYLRFTAINYYGSGGAALQYLGIE